MLSDTTAQNGGSCRVTYEGIFIKKSTGRAKSNGEELSAVNDISASKTKSESLKVRKIDMLYRFFCNCNGK